jgi:hypothetical protein
MESLRQFYRLPEEGYSRTYSWSTSLIVLAISRLGRGFMAKPAMPAALASAARFCYRSLLLLVCLYAFLDCLCDKLFLLGNKVFSVLQG